jgi:hypothetical protein
MLSGDGVGKYGGKSAPRQSGFVVTNQVNRLEEFEVYFIVVLSDYIRFFVMPQEAYATQSYSPMALNLRSCQHG